MMFTGKVACVLFQLMASMSEAHVTYGMTYGVGQVRIFASATCEIAASRNSTLDS